MPVQRLKEFLDQNQVRYVRISHSPAFTAQEVAASAHIPGKELAKTVMVEIDGKMAMAVVPASCRIDLQQLKQVTGARELHLAPEEAFRDRFPGCDVGAMPPFGNLYAMDVFVAEALAEDEDIAFTAGSHTELVRLSYQDYERLVQPKVLKFAACVAAG